MPSARRELTKYGEQSSIQTLVGASHLHLGAYRGRSLTFMKRHKLCRLFPEITGDDFKALVADIKANGLRQPIITLDDQILDGQNRFNACMACGIKPQFDKFIGDDPLAFVISQNMARRHLTDSQRAVIAAEIATAKRGDNRRPIDRNWRSQKEPVSISEAAVQMHVSERQVGHKGEKRRNVLERCAQ